MLIRTGWGGQLSGSVGGVTASHNRYGQYLRNRSVPVNPNTALQQEVRSSFGASAIAWKGLTQEVRDNWQAYATATPTLNRLGETITLSAFAWFVAVTSFRLQIGLGVPNFAPVTPGLATLGTDRNFSVLAGALSFAATAGTVTGFGLVLYSPLVSAGASSFSGPYSRFGIGTLLPSGMAAVVQTGFRFGVPTVGESRFFSIRGSGLTNKLSDVHSQKLEWA